MASFARRARVVFYGVVCARGVTLQLGIASVQPSAVNIAENDLADTSALTSTGALLERLPPSAFLTGDGSSGSATKLDSAGLVDEALSTGVSPVDAGILNYTPVAPWVDVESELRRHICGTDAELQSIGIDRSKTTCSIALLVPTLGGHGVATKLLPRLFRSLSKTVTPNACRLGVFLAYDSPWDSWFASEEDMAAAGVKNDGSNRSRAIVETSLRTEGPPGAELHWVPNLGDRTYTSAVEAAAQSAMKEGYEYLFQIGDDIIFVTPGWDVTFRDSLRSMGGFGAVGPFQDNRPVLLQAFVGRSHMCFFQHFFPPAFRNIYTDDWLTEVYRRFGRMKQHTEIVVENKRKARYFQRRWNTDTVLEFMNKSYVRVKDIACDADPSLARACIAA